MNRWMVGWSYWPRTLRGFFVPVSRGRDVITIASALGPEGCDVIASLPVERGRSTLPRGTYVKWDVEKWLEIDSYMEKETKEVEENTQEELA